VHDAQVVEKIPQNERDVSVNIKLIPTRVTRTLKRITLFENLEDVDHLIHETGTALVGQKRINSLQAYLFIRSLRESWIPWMD
jgi:hypothetical protein